MDAALLSRLIKDYLMPSTPGATMTQVVRAAADENVRPQAIFPILEANPVYERSLLGLSDMSKKVSEWNDEDPQNLDKERIITTRLLGLIGKSSVRNLVTCFRQNRMTGQGLPKKAKDKLVVSPREQIKLARDTEELCQDKSWVHPETAFLAALHYDWLMALLAAQKGPKDARAYVEDCYKEGLLNAQLAYEIAERLKSVPLDRYLFGAALLAPLGKSLLNLFHPKDQKEKSWVQFVTEREAAPLVARPAFRTREKKRFGLGHAHYSALYASYFEFFQPVERAIAFYEDPYYLAKVDPDQYVVSMIVSIAVRLRESKDGSGGIPLEQFHTKWMDEVKLKVDDLKAIAVKLAKGQKESGKK